MTTMPTDGTLAAPDHTTTLWIGRDPTTGLIVQVEDAAIGADDDQHTAELMAQGYTWEAARAVVLNDHTNETTAYWLAKGER